MIRRLSAVYYAGVSYNKTTTMVFNMQHTTYQVIHLLQSTTLKFFYIIVTAVCELVYQTIITEYNVSHSFDECFAVNIGNVVKILNKTWYHHTSALFETFSLTLWNLHQMKCRQHYLSQLWRLRSVYYSQNFKDLNAKSSALNSKRGP